MVVGQPQTKWSEEWLRAKRGDGCRMCKEKGGPAVYVGPCFYSGGVVNAYLYDCLVMFGTTLVCWRGRHVAEPTELTDDEACAYERELLKVARALEQRYKPIKLGFLTIGLTVPHLHTAIILRYLDDPAPSKLLHPGWFSPPNEPGKVQAEAAALRAALV